MTSIAPLNRTAEPTCPDYDLLLKKAQEGVKQEKKINGLTLKEMGDAIRKELGCQEPVSPHTSSSKKPDENPTLELADISKIEPFFPKGTDLSKYFVQTVHDTFGPKGSPTVGVNKIPLNDFLRNAYE